METPTRTFLKSFLWAAWGLVTMAVVGFAFTGSFSVGGAMALVNSIIGFVMYTGYERIWANIAWGRRA